MTAFSLLNRQKWWLTLTALSLSALATLLVMQPAPASAHQDPVDCFETGVGLSLGLFRADGTTPVGSGSVESNENVNYRATLSALGGDNCNFESGTLTVTTPDGAVHDVTGVGIPLVSVGSPFVSVLVPYVVAEADVAGGVVTAAANYTGGIAHTGDVHDIATASVTRNTPYVDNELVVTKTADPAFDREFFWDIEKVVDIDLHILEPGQSGDSEYTVTVTQTGSEDTGHRVSGTISVFNPATFASANITDVSDVIEGVGAVVVDCGVVFPFALAPGATLDCTYGSDLPDDATRLNTASATTDGDVGGGSGDASIDFTGVDPTNVVNETVNVDDTFAGSLGSFSGTGSVSYSRTFTCNEDEGIHDNIATIIETGQSDDASVEVICTPVALVVEKTAAPAFDREFFWDIEKSVTPEVWDLFVGDSGTSEYTVTVTQTGSEDSGHRVSGTISVFNPAAVASATITGVSDDIEGVGAAVVDCGVAFPFVLGPGATLDCTYESSLPDDATRLNTATASTEGDVGGGSGNASIDFTGVDPTNVVNETVNVDDTFAGDLGSFSGTDSVSYSRTFACGADEGVHDNVATIVETGQSDDASVTVNCYDLEVSKTADESLDRTWEWTIVKSADQSSLEINEGDVATVNYTVVVSAVSTDGNWHVEGEITIVNNHPSQDAVLTNVSDLVSPGIAATVDCPSLVVPAGGSLVCTYSADLPDGSDQVNTATATQQNHDFDSAGVGTPSGTTDYSGDAPVDFASAPVSEIDECVEVSDTNVGVLGIVCADAVPGEFNYSLTFSTNLDADVVLECGENQHPNVASFVTNDTSATGSSEWVVDITVICEELEGLTPGFWKNHTDLWVTFSAGDTVGSVFDLPAYAAELSDDSLVDALNYSGGGGSIGMARNLLRASVAAILNAEHSEVTYFMSSADIIDAVNAALATGDRGVMEDLKNLLDANNNLGGGIDAHGNPV